MPNTAEELTLRINGDSASGQSAVQGFIGSLEGLKGKTENVGESLVEAFTHPLQAIEELAGSLGGGLGPAIGATEIAIGGLVAGFAAVGIAAFEFAEHAAAVGGHLKDLSLKTGITVPELSHLSNALTVAGSSADTMANAIVMMQRNMTEDGAKFEEGIHRIGLSLSDLQALTPDQQFERLAEAIAHTSDPAQRSAAAMEIFGRQGRELLPTLLKLNESMELTASITPWSEEQAHEAEQFELQTRALKLQFEQITITLGRELLPAVIAVVGWFGEGVRQSGSFGDMLRDSLIPGYQTFTEWLGRGALAAETAGAKQDTINRAVEYGAPVTIKYADAAKYLTEQFSYLQPQQASATALADKWLEKLTANATKALETAAAHAKLTEQLAELGIVEGEQFDFAKGVLKEEEKRRHEKELYRELLVRTTELEGGYKLVLEQLSDDTVQSIFYELQHKVALKDIADLYEVMPVQVQILAEAQKQQAKEAADALKLLESFEDAFRLRKIHEDQKAIDAEIHGRAAWLDAQDRTEKDANDLWSQYTDLVEKRTLSSTEYQKQKIYEWEAAQLAALDYTGEHWKEKYDAIEAITAEKLGAVKEAHSVLFNDVQHMLDQMAGTDKQSGWGQHFATVLVETHSFHDGFAAVWTDIKNAVKKILADMLTDFIDGYLGSASKALGSWLGSLGSGGGGGGWWSSLLGALIPGFGGSPGGDQPGGPGHFDGDGNWIPDAPAPSGGGTGDPPDTGLGPRPPGKEAMGGVIPDYFARGSFVGFRPSGTDTVPAMLTPGEGVLNLRAMGNFGRENLNILNSGGRVGDLGGAGRPQIVVNVDASNSIFRDRQAIDELAQAIGQSLADHYMQVGGSMPLDH